MASLRRWFLSGVCLAVCALNVGCFSGSSGTALSGGSGRTGQAKGVREATDAIAAGKLKMKEFPPLPSPAQHGEYVHLLKEKCGVDYEVPQLPAGVAEADFIQEVRSWNETMETEIKRKFGEGIFTELHQEADKRWQKKVNSKK